MLGALLGAGISAATNLFASNKQAKANEKARQEDYARQKEFAQSGITWKVEDARKAGIHPAIALGAQPASFSPIGVGDTGTQYLAQAGQDISRAIDTTRTASSRISAFDQTVQGLTVQKMGLENELLASQVAKVKQQIGPPMAGDDYLIPGQPLSGLERTSPAQATPVLKMMGRGLYDTGNWSDAQAFEDVGGEGVGDWFSGPLSFLDRIRVGQSNLPVYKAWREHRAKGGRQSVKEFARRYHGF